MKAVIAIDSFKGSMDSIEAGKAAEEGIRRVFLDAETIVYPLADGGEGTVQALAKGLGGRLEEVTVTGPLGEPVICEYGIVEESGRNVSVMNGGGVEKSDISIDRMGEKSKEDSWNKDTRAKTAIIEMAGAAGITLVPPELRNPLNTTTYGVGEVIKDAIGKGCRHFIIGIGGSATNDGGIGMLQALGVELLDEGGKQVPFGARGVEKLTAINCEHMLSELKDCDFQIACDVDNPLCGENGCSHIFGPQKGATPEMVEQMDQWMKKYAQLTAEYFQEVGSDDLEPERKKNAAEKELEDNPDLMKAEVQFKGKNLSVNAADFGTSYNSDYPGCGAAGGLGFAFRAFLHGKLEPGINIVLEEIGIESAIKYADIVITGEGRLDGQTIRGKAPIGIARLAKKYGKPVIAFSGAVTEDATACNLAGIDAFFPILRQITTLETAMSPATAQRNMTVTVEQVFRLLKMPFVCGNTTNK